MRNNSNTCGIWCDPTEHPWDKSCLCEAYQAPFLLRRRPICSVRLRVWFSGSLELYYYISRCTFYFVHPARRHLRSAWLHFKIPMWTLCIMATLRAMSIWSGSRISNKLYALEELYIWISLAWHLNLYEFIIMNGYLMIWLAYHTCKGNYSHWIWRNMIKGPPHPPFFAKELHFTNWPWQPNWTWI